MTATGPRRVGEILRGDSILTGHLIVVALMKRLTFLVYRDRGGRLAEPHHVDGTLGAVVPGYIENPNPDLHTYKVAPLRTSHFGESWKSLYQEATRRRDHEPMQGATKADLYRMARFLVAKIDAAEPREDHQDYPHEWREAYELIKHGRPTAAQTEEPPPEEARSARSEVLDYLDYVSEKLGQTYDEILERIGRDRLSLAPEDKGALLALLK